MSKMQRDKGKRFEQLIAKEMRKVFGGHVRRGWQARDGKDAPDVVGTPFWIECKHHKKVNIKAALKQAKDDCVLSTNPNIPPLAICKDDREEPIVAMYLSDFIRLMEETNVAQNIQKPKRPYCSICDDYHK